MLKVRVASSVWSSEGGINTHEISSSPSTAAAVATLHPLLPAWYVFSNPWAGWTQKQHHWGGQVCCGCHCFAAGQSVLWAVSCKHTCRHSSHNTHCSSQQPCCVGVACPVLRAADVQAICLLLKNPPSLGQSYSKVRARAVRKCNIALQEEKIPVWERDAQSSWIRNRYVFTCLRFRCYCHSMLRSSLVMSFFKIK